MSEGPEPMTDEALVEVESAAVEPEPPPPVAEPVTRPGMRWYVLRVASNREEQVRDALARKVKIEGLEERIGRILVPMQREKRVKGGQAKLYDRKLYPGYVFVEMAPDETGRVSEDVWFVVKDTSGVGDFIGTDGKPTEMKPQDVERMLSIVEKSEEAPTLAGMAGMNKGDLVKIKEGAFENFEGEIDEVMPDKGQVRVIVSIFGRATPIELEYWQVERM
jgi:transcriptional antiterminator NusG